MDLTNALESTLNPDIQIRTQAEEYLNGLQQQNLPVFLVSLVIELANEQKSAHSRQAAGLRLKNLLDARDVQRKQTLALQWRQQGDDVKVQVRAKVLEVLHSQSKEARKTAAQVLASIAAIEIPVNQWLSVITDLVNNVTTPKTPFGVESSLMALGYLCEECRAPGLMQQSNSILTAVVQGMRQTDNNDIRFAATDALLNALEFVKSNFGDETERNFIMSVVCESTTSEDERVRVASMQCLVKIAFLYYEYLPPYIEALFNITVKSAKTDTEDVALQAIEFWSTISEMEDEIQEDIRYAEESGEEAERVSHNFIVSALGPLVSLMTELMVRQEEDQTDDDWNVSISASKCLSMMARVASDAIVPVTMPFISANVNNEDWHYREAATLAFSAILEGPQPSSDMTKLINEAIPLMLARVQDEMVIVRDTTVFTLGRIAKFHPEPLIEGHLQSVLQILTTAMLEDKEASVASKACWAVHNIAETIEDEGDKPTNHLSPYFQILTQALLKVFDRDDLDEGNLRINSYGAFSALVSSASRDQFNYVVTLVPVIMQRLADTIPAFNAHHDAKTREEISIVQGFLCGTLQTLVHKLKESVRQVSDDMMKLFLSLFELNPAIHEEVLFGISAIAGALGDQFERYMQYVMPCLLGALKNHQAISVCTVAISIVTDICVALGEKTINYSDQIMETLLSNLQSPTVDKSLKPAIISCFSDIAVNVEEKFDRYMNYVATILDQASKAEVDQSSEEMIEYLNQLRESIFESYSGIMQGMKRNTRAFDQCVDSLVNLLKVVAKDQTIDEDVFKAAVNVIGDLANVYGSKAKNLLNTPDIVEMVKDATKAQDKETKAIARWVQKELQKI